MFAHANGRLKTQMGVKIIGRSGLNLFYLKPFIFPFTPSTNPFIYLFWHFFICFIILIRPANTFKPYIKPNLHAHDTQNAFITDDFHFFSGFLQPGYFALSGSQWQSQVWQKYTVSHFAQPLWYHILKLISCAVTRLMARNCAFFLFMPAKPVSLAKTINHHSPPTTHKLNSPSA